MGSARSASSEPSRGTITLEYIMVPDPFESGGGCENTAIVLSPATHDGQCVSEVVVTVLQAVCILIRDCPIPGTGGGLDETTRQASGLGDTGPGPIVGLAQCGAGAGSHTHPLAQPSSTVWEYCPGLSCCPGRLRWLSWTSRRHWPSPSSPCSPSFPNTPSKW